MAFILLFVFYFLSSSTIGHVLRKNVIHPHVSKFSGTDSDSTKRLTLPVVVDGQDDSDLVPGLLDASPNEEEIDELFHTQTPNIQTTNFQADDTTGVTREFGPTYEKFVNTGYKLLGKAAIVKDLSEPTNKFEETSDLDSRNEPVFLGGHQNKGFNKPNTDFHSKLVESSSRKPDSNRQADDGEANSQEDFHQQLKQTLLQNRFRNEQQNEPLERESSDNFVSDSNGNSQDRNNDSPSDTMISEPVNRFSQQAGKSHSRNDQKIDEENGDSSVDRLENHPTVNKFPLNNEEKESSSNSFDNRNNFRSDNNDRDQDVSQYPLKLHKHNSHNNGNNRDDGLYKSPISIQKGAHIDNYEKDPESLSPTESINIDNLGNLKNLEVPTSSPEHSHFENAESDENNRKEVADTNEMDRPKARGKLETNRYVGNDLDDNQKYRPELTDRDNEDQHRILSNEHVSFNLKYNENVGNKQNDARMFANQNQNSENKFENNLDEQHVVHHDDMLKSESPHVVHQSNTLVQNLDDNSHFNTNEDRENVKVHKEFQEPLFRGDQGATPEIQYQQNEHQESDSRDEALKPDKQDIHQDRNDPINGFQEHLKQTNLEDRESPNELTEEIKRLSDDALKLKMIGDKQLSLSFEKFRASKLPKKYPNQQIYDASQPEPNDGEQQKQVNFHSESNYMSAMPTNNHASPVKEKEIEPHDVAHMAGIMNWGGFNHNAPEPQENNKVQGNHQESENLRFARLDNNEPRYPPHLPHMSNQQQHNIEPEFYHTQQRNERMVKPDVQPEDNNKNWGIAHQPFFKHRNLANMMHENLRHDREPNQGFWQTVHHRSDALPINNRMVMNAYQQKNVNNLMNSQPKLNNHQVVGMYQQPRVEHETYINQQQNIPNPPLNPERFLQNPPNPTMVNMRNDPLTVNSNSERFSQNPPNPTMTNMRNDPLTVNSNGERFSQNPPNPTMTNMRNDPLTVNSNSERFSQNPPNPTMTNMRNDPFNVNSNGEVNTNKLANPEPRIGHFQSSTMPDVSMSSSSTNFAKPEVIRQTFEINQQDVNVPDVPMPNKHLDNQKLNVKSNDNLQGKLSSAYNQLNLLENADFNFKTDHLRKPSVRRIHHDVIYSSKRNKHRNHQTYKPNKNHIQQVNSKKLDESDLLIRKALDVLNEKEAKAATYEVLKDGEELKVAQKIADSSPSPGSLQRHQVLFDNIGYEEADLADRRHLANHIQQPELTNNSITVPEDAAITSKIIDNLSSGKDIKHVSSIDQAHVKGNYNGQHFDEAAGKPYHYGHNTATSDNNWKKTGVSSNQTNNSSTNHTQDHRRQIILHEPDQKLNVKKNHAAKRSKFRVKKRHLADHVHRPDLMDSGITIPEDAAITNKIVENLSTGKDIKHISGIDQVEVKGHYGGQHFKQVAGKPYRYGQHSHHHPHVFGSRMNEIGNWKKMTVNEYTKAIEKHLKKAVHRRQMVAHDTNHYSVDTNMLTHFHHPHQRYPIGEMPNIKVPTPPLYQGEIAKDDQMTNDIVSKISTDNGYRYGHSKRKHISKKKKQKSKAASRRHDVAPDNDPFNFSYQSHGILPPLSPRYHPSVFSHVPRQDMLTDDVHIDNIVHHLTSGGDTDDVGDVKSLGFGPGYSKLTDSFIPPKTITWNHREASFMNHFPTHFDRPGPYLSNPSTTNNMHNDIKNTNGIVDHLVSGSDLQHFDSHNDRNYHIFGNDIQIHGHGNSLDNGFLYHHPTNQNQRVTIDMHRTDNNNGVVSNYKNRTELYSNSFNHNSDFPMVGAPVPPPTFHNAPLEREPDRTYHYSVYEKDPLPSKVTTTMTYPPYQDSKPHVNDYPSMENVTQRVNFDRNENDDFHVFHAAQGDLGREMEKGSIDSLHSVIIDHNHMNENRPDMNFNSYNAPHEHVVDKNIGTMPVPNNVNVKAVDVMPHEISNPTPPIPRLILPNEGGSEDISPMTHMVSHTEHVIKPHEPVVHNDAPSPVSTVIRTEQTENKAKAEPPKQQEDVKITNDSINKAVHSIDLGDIEHQFHDTKHEELTEHEKVNKSEPPSPERVFEKVKVKSDELKPVQHEDEKVVEKEESVKDKEKVTHDKEDIPLSAHKERDRERKHHHKDSRDEDDDDRDTDLPRKYEHHRKDDEDDTKSYHHKDDREEKVRKNDDEDEEDDHRNDQPRRHHNNDREEKRKDERKFHLKKRIEEDDAENERGEKNRKNESRDDPEHRKVSHEDEEDDDSERHFRGRKKLNRPAADVEYHHKKDDDDDDEQELKQPESDESTVQDNEPDHSKPRKYHNRTHHEVEPEIEDDTDSNLVKSQVYSTHPVEVHRNHSTEEVVEDAPTNEDFLDEGEVEHQFTHVPTVHRYHTPVHKEYHFYSNEAAPREYHEDPQKAVTVTSPSQQPTILPQEEVRLTVPTQEEISVNEMEPLNSNIVLHEDIPMDASNLPATQFYANNNPPRHHIHHHYHHYGHRKRKKSDNIQVRVMLEDQLIRMPGQGVLRPQYPTDVNHPAEPYVQKTYILGNNTQRRHMVSHQQSHYRLDGPEFGHHRPLAILPPFYQDANNDYEKDAMTTTKIIHHLASGADLKHSPESDAHDYQVHDNDLNIHSALDNHLHLQIPLDDHVDHHDVEAFDHHEPLATAENHHDDIHHARVHHEGDEGVYAGNDFFEQIGHPYKINIHRVGHHHYHHHKPLTEVVNHYHHVHAVRSDRKNVVSKKHKKNGLSARRQLVLRNPNHYQFDNFETHYDPLQPPRDGFYNFVRKSPKFPHFTTVALAKDEALTDQIVDNLSNGEGIGDLQRINHLNINKAFVANQNWPVVRYISRLLGKRKLSGGRKTTKHTTTSKLQRRHMVTHHPRRIVADELPPQGFAPDQDNEGAALFDLQGDNQQPTVLMALQDINRPFHFHGRGHSFDDLFNAGMTVSNPMFSRLIGERNPQEVPDAGEGVLSSADPVATKFGPSPAYDNYNGFPPLAPMGAPTSFGDNRNRYAFMDKSMQQVPTNDVMTEKVVFDLSSGHDIKDIHGDDNIRVKGIYGGNEFEDASPAILGYNEDQHVSFHRNPHNRDSDDGFDEHFPDMEPVMHKPHFSKHKEHRKHHLHRPHKPNQHHFHVPVATTEISLDENRVLDHDDTGAYEMGPLRGVVVPEKDARKIGLYDEDYLEKLGVWDDDKTHPSTWIDALLREHSRWGTDGDLNAQGRALNRTKPNGTEKCHVPADVAFLFDGSKGDKVKERYFQRYIEFAKQIVKYHPPSMQGYHYGAVVYSNVGELQFNFDLSYDVTGVVDELEKLKKTYPSKTNGSQIGQGMKVVKEELFDKSGRDWVSQVLIVLTDSKSSDDVGNVSQALRDSTVNIFVIGLANKDSHSDIGQMEKIASLPTKHHAFQVDIEKLLGTSEAVTHPQHLARVLPYKLCRMNLVFVIDMKANDASRLSAIKGFIKSSTSDLAIGSYGNHVAVVGYGGKVKKSGWDLTRFDVCGSAKQCTTDRVQFLKAVDNLENESGKEKNAGSALQRALIYYFDQKYEDRRGQFLHYVNVTVILTDRQLDGPYETAARKLRNHGVIVHSIGWLDANKGVARSTLAEAASDSDEFYLHTHADIITLDTVAKRMKQYFSLLLWAHEGESKKITDGWEADFTGTPKNSSQQKSKLHRLKISKRTHSLMPLVHSSEGPLFDPQPYNYTSGSLWNTTGITYGPSYQYNNSSSESSSTEWQSHTVGNKTEVSEKTVNRTMNGTKPEISERLLLWDVDEGSGEMKNEKDPSMLPNQSNHDDDYTRREVAFAKNEVESKGNVEKQTSEIRTKSGQLGDSRNPNTAPVKKAAVISNNGASKESDVTKLEDFLAVARNGIPISRGKLRKKRQN